MKRFAVFLSYLLHPILSPLISIYLLFQLPIYHNYRFSDSFFNFIYLSILINLIFIPLLASYYLKSKGMIQSLKMERTQDRRIPFLLTAFLYFITYWFFESISFPEFYLKIFLAATAVVMILSALVFLNIKWSAHLSAMGGIIGMLVVVDQTFNFNITILLIVLILLSGLLASARLVLGAHRIHELAFGFLLGFGAQMLLLI